MGLSLAEEFKQYFSIHYAQTKPLLERSYQIRHEVYAKELGWEPVNPEGIETDECDDYSHVCLLQHRNSQTYAGTVRLVIPPCNRASALLPFEAHCADSLWREKLDPAKLTRGSFGEISRLAVPSEFRRRKTDKSAAFQLDESSSTSVFSESERRHFPYIAIGLYFASIALVDICRHEGVFVMMEPRLQRHLQRFGLPFFQVGDKLDFRGTRAMHFLSKERLTSELKPDLKELYERLKLELTNQIHLVPYNTHVH